MRKSRAAMVDQKHIMPVHQWTKQRDVAVAGAGRWIPWPAFHCDDGFQALCRWALVGIKLETNLDRLARSAGRVKRANDRAAVSRHALTSSQPQRSDLNFRL